MPHQKPDTVTATEASGGFWRLGRADRLGLVVDGENWFPAFADLVAQARQQAIILCWDVDSRVQMRRPAESNRAPEHLTAVLHRALEQNPGLTIHLLPWDFAMIYAFEREWLPLFARPLARHPRLRVRYDGEHPVGASQHQKLLVIDDRTAMVGGFDPSKWRWDHRDHAADDPARRDPDGQPYPPFHDLAFAVTGPICRDLGELARERWQRATGERLGPPALPAGEPPWPADRVSVTLEQATVGICRTLPAWRDQPEAREIETTLCRLIDEARECIYIENQYFTSHRIGDALIASLEAETGPEVIVLLPREKDGWLERLTMDVLRARLIERLREADRHGRLRLFYPAVVGLEPDMVSLHSKLVIGDDRHINLGSANTSNRSMGFDSELNLSLLGDRDEARRAIASMRHELLGEHLGCRPEAVARAEREAGSVAAAIDHLNRPGEDRWLEPLRITLDPEIDRQIPGAAVIDPEHARPPEELIDMFIEKKARRPLRRKAAAFAVLIALTVITAGLLKFTPLGESISPGDLLARLGDLRETPGGTWLFLGLAIVGLLLGLPATPVVVVAALLFGAWTGFGLAYGALTLAALLGFVTGHFLGSEALRRLAGKRLDELSRRLARRGILTVFSLRLIPLAPFTVVNLVAGATRIRFRDFLIGSLAGLVPGTAALTIFSDQLLRTVLEPSAATIGVLALLTALFIGIGWGLSRWLALREQASGTS
ncbi:VTT domain-containing protein [Guyparkeria hydrothermalis]|uniref:VTT domain-containing protein n=1 Tax=Guyparkeria hydrothermalis TaxID=923 RepID=UPI00202284A5|nr:VTT domain-containing protein [Guyparkeria hydrothermalis]MCL7745025.1 VTT domain-containing protein [Guyparkeria hydrothermalis]